MVLRNIKIVEDMEKVKVIERFLLIYFIGFFKIGIIDRY